MKINIEIHYTTVNRIISSFRKQGLIKPNGSWKRFLKMYWDSLYTMDFMTIDTFFGKRFYFLIILELKTREIVRFDMTASSCREFVKQGILLFLEKYDGQKKTLIYDNAAQFTSIYYNWYDIKGVNICTSALKAGRRQAFCSPMHPCMNAFVERLYGTIRRETLDQFLLISEKQVHNIVSEFVEYYNTRRMHQGINKIPDAEIDNISGTIKKKRILSGLQHDYYRSSAEM